MSPPTTLRESLRALPPAAWILFLGTFINRFGGFVVPFLALYMTSQGYSLSSAGLAIGAYGVGNVFATLIGGYLADHLGRQRTIVLSLFSGAAVMLLLSQARGLVGIVSLLALAGLTGEFYRPASSALLTDLVPAEGRVTAFAAYRMAINAGFAFGPATAGFLAGRGYFWLFAGDAATSAAFGFVVLLAIPRGGRSPSRAAGWGQAASAVAGDRRLHRILLATLGIAVIFCQVGSTFGIAVLRLGFPASTYGLLLSLNGLLIVLVELPLTTLTRRLPAMPVIATGFALVGAGFGSILFARTVPALAACIVVFTLGEMCAMPVASAYVAGLAPGDMRGRYMGAYGLTWTVAQVLAPGLGMRLFAADATLYWVMCGALGLASAAVLLGWAPSRGPAAEGAGA
jgi:MFS family permease